MSPSSTLYFFDNDGSKVSNMNNSSGLKMSARNYTLADSAQNREGLTLLFAHCVGSYEVKEYWEPVIERLFSLRPGRIREVWAFDWQNHGDSAVVNEDILKERTDEISVYEWAKAIQNFVASERMKGHRIVAIGHSAGAGTVTLSSLTTPLSDYPYAALVLVEATMITREHFHASFEDRMLQMEFTVSSTLARRDKWASRETAYEWMLKRFPWNIWDPRMARLTADYGLRPTNSKSDEVTLKCPKRQEAAMYSAVDGHFEAMDELKRICKTVPVHAVWGENEDIVVGDIRDAMGDASQGRVLASVTTVPDCGHMVVQENPGGLADVIAGIIDTVHTTVKTKL